MYPKQIQDPKMKVLYHILGLIWLGHRPCIYRRYLQIRFLKLLLIIGNLFHIYQHGYLSIPITYYHTISWGMNIHLPANVHQECQR